MRVIGLDPGFGGIKVAAIEEGTLRTAHVPAVVGVGSTDLGLLSLGEFRRHRRRRSGPDTVAFEGVEYLVGENVHRYARPVERMDFHRLSGGAELQAAIYAALARVFEPGEHETPVLLGLPVEVMSDRSQAQEVLRAIRGWFLGEHVFRVNDVDYVVKIREVRAMPQPAGAFFAWGLDNTGRWVRGKEALRQPVGICDIGFNTLDLFAVEAGDVVGRFTAGDTVGMRRAAELLAQTLRRQYGLELSLHEADALLRQKAPHVHVAGQGTVSVARMVRQALETTAAYVVRFLEERWGRGRQFAHILFSGGGAEMLRDVLLRQYPYGEVLPDAVTANAVGLARYAVRVWGK